MPKPPLTPHAGQLLEVEPPEGQVVGRIGGVVRGINAPWREGEVAGGVRVRSAPSAPSCPLLPPFRLS